MVFLDWLRGLFGSRKVEEKVESLEDQMNEEIPRVMAFIKSRFNRLEEEKADHADVELLMRLLSEDVLGRLEKIEKKMEALEDKRDKDLKEESKELPEEAQEEGKNEGSTSLAEEKVDRNPEGNEIERKVIKHMVDNDWKHSRRLMDEKDINPESIKDLGDGAG